MVSGVGSRNRVILSGRARWRHLANTVERLFAVAVSGSPTSGGDAACFQITLGVLVMMMYHVGDVRVRDSGQQQRQQQQYRCTVGQISEATV